MPNDPSDLRAVSPVDLEELQKHLDAMTPGPWELTGAVMIWSPPARANVAAASALRATSHVAYTEPDLGDLNEPAANAEGIVYLRNTVPALVEEVRQLRQKQAHWARLLVFARQYFITNGHPDTESTTRRSVAIFMEDTADVIDVALGPAPSRGGS